MYSLFGDASTEANDDDGTPSNADDGPADAAGAHDMPDATREQPTATITKVAVVAVGIVVLAVLAGVGIWVGLTGDGTDDG